MAQREAERLRREQDPQYEPQGEPERSKRKERRQKDGKPQKTETFFSNNSRLIAFIITSVLIITVFSPFAIDMLLERLDDNKTVTDKKDMTIQHVYVISENYGSITWKSFEQFNYTDMSRDDGKYYTREYPISDGKFVLKVGGKTMSGQPEYMYLISLIDDKYINLAQDNVKKFVNNYQDQ